jgi:hypothetical protein
VLAAFGTFDGVIVVEVGEGGVAGTLGVVRGVATPPV